MDTKTIVDDVRPVTRQNKCAISTSRAQILRESVNIALKASCEPKNNNDF